MNLNGIDSGYGETQVLYGLSLEAQAGRVLAILGRNGAGKSTTLKTIMGLLPLTSGQIVFDGKPIPARPFDVAKSGIAYVPETRDIFPSLTRAREPRDRGQAVRRQRAGLDDGAGAGPLPASGRADGRTAARNSPAASSRCSPSRGRC